MPSLNRVQLIGRLGRDPETRSTTTGKKVVRFSMAINRRLKTEGGVKDFTEWVNVDAWDQLAETCQEYLHKGSLIYLEGRLKTDHYEDKEGETKYYTKVVASFMQMLDRKPEEEPVLSVEEEQAEYVA